MNETKHTPIVCLERVVVEGIQKTIDSIKDLTRMYDEASLANGAFRDKLNAERETQVWQTLKQIEATLQSVSKILK